MELLTLKDAYAVKQPIIYGLCREDGVIRYVGKTVNPSKRLQSYFYPTKYGNYRLRKWLKESGGSLRFVILELDPDDLSASELKHIHARKGLLNIDMGDGQHKVTPKNPWSAGVKNACPSAVIIRHLSLNKAEGVKEKVDKVKAIRKAMSQRRRMNFELDLAAQYKNHLVFGGPLRRWAQAVNAEI